jgi:hypothetical protein
MEVIEFVSEYLERRYHRPTITVMNGCCRQCLRGEPSGYDLKKKSIKELMIEGEIEPHQIASAFYTGSAYHAPYFKEMVINVKSEEIPCKYPGNCNLTCIICRSLITKGDEVELDIWPGFKAHKSCTARCQYPCCPNFIPTLPAYLSTRTLLCKSHAPEKIEPEIAVIEPKPSKTETFTPRKTFKKPILAKADKFDEKGKSKSILTFLDASKKKVEVEKVQVVQPRLLKNKTTGKVFGYWKDGTAYHIDTDMPLFQTKEVSTKFDYSPPSPSIQPLMRRSRTKAEPAPDTARTDHRPISFVMPYLAEVTIRKAVMNSVECPVMIDTINTRISQ